MNKVARMLVICTLVFMFGHTAYAKTHDMASMPGMQSVEGIASTTDANRHYLDHLGVLQSASAAGTTTPADTSAAISAGVAFHTWFMNAIQGFNDTQTTVTDSATQQANLAAFISQRDAQVAYYMDQLTAKLSTLGCWQMAAYIKGSIPKMKSGISQSDYDKYFLSDAERKSQERNGGGTGVGTYNCSHGVFTCSATYSIAGGSTNGTNNVSDNFNRPNGGLGSDWTADYGTFAISSDTATVSSGGSGGTAFTHYSGVTFAGDQFDQFTIKSLPASGNSFCLTLRETSASNNYYTCLYNGGGWYDVISGKNVNGTNNQWDSTAYGYTPAVGDVYLFTVQGSILTIWLNSVQIQQYSDTSLTSGSPGLMGTIGGGAVGNFLAGNMGATLDLNPIVDGTTTMSGPPFGNLHTPTVKVTLNGSQQTYNGTQVCQTCYLYASNVFALPFTSGNSPQGVADDGTFECTDAGTFFDAGTEDWQYELALTYGQNIDNNRTKGGTTYGSPYQWSYPVGPYYGVPVGTWESFNSSGVIGYSYKLQNWCSNTTTPDLDLTNFKAIMPNIYLTGGSWNGLTVPVQGGTVLVEMWLYRATNASAWTYIAPWNTGWVALGPSENTLDDPWNYPAFLMTPQNTMDGYIKGPCTIGAPASTHVSPPNLTSCLGPSGGHNGQIIACP